MSNIYQFINGNLLNKLCITGTMFSVFNIAKYCTALYGQKNSYCGWSQEIQIKYGFIDSGELIVR